MSDETDYIEERARESIKFLSEVEDVYLPKTVKQAEHESWSLAADMVQVTLLLGYDQQQRKQDRQRVVPLKSVLKILSDLEQESVTSMVLQPTDLLFNFAYGFVNLCVVALPRLCVYFADTWTHPDRVRLWWRLIKSFLDKFFELVSVTEVSRMIQSGLTRRDQFTNLVRQKALPQQNGPRYRRRKVTRK